jgi:hypothetical protein
VRFVQDKNGKVEITIGTNGDWRERLHREWS